MKELITGGAGFIGSNFVHYWANKYPNDKIIVLDKLTYAGNLENLSDLEDNKNITFIKGDIANKKLVDQLFTKEKFDLVIHFAAETHVDRSLMNSSDFVKTNVLGTQVLLEASLRHKIKHFHHVSTDEVFGAIGENEHWKFTENTPYHPRNPYSASKAAADHLVRSYNISLGLPVTITNCSNNYGPYLFPEKLISLAITNLIEGKTVPIYGSGKQSRDWLYVEDHCRVIEIVILKGRIGETYCVGGMNEEITNIEVIQKICKIMGKDFDSSIVFVKDRPGHDFKYIVDWKKIHKELGWKPRYKFDKWLKKTVKWYEKNTIWWQNIKKGSYKNYYNKQYKKDK